MKKGIYCLMAVVACVYSAQVSARNVVDYNTVDRENNIVEEALMIVFKIPSQGVKLANVCSVNDIECREKAMMFDIADEDFITQCQDEGYTKTADTCPTGQIPDPGTQCPYLSTLYKKCLCDTSVYTHTGTDTSVCGSYNVTVNTCTDTSGTHFSCECNAGTLCDGETQYVLPAIMSDTR